RAEHAAPGQPGPAVDALEPRRFQADLFRHALVLEGLHDQLVRHDRMEHAAEPELALSTAVHEVGERVAAENSEREPGPAFVGEVGALVDGEDAEAGQETGEPQVQVGEGHAALDGDPGPPFGASVASAPPS